MKTLLTFILALNVTCAYAAQPSLFIVNAHCNFDNTINNVKQAAISNNFRVVRESDLSVKNIKIHAIWFCNFELLNTAIHRHKSVGYLLPFRVTVVERNGKVTVSTLNPDQSSALVKSKLGHLCNKMTGSYKEILDEVSL